MMKKILLCLVLLTVMGNCFAQEMVFQMGNKTNKRTSVVSMIRLTEGVLPGQLLVVEPEMKAVTGPKTNPVKSVKVRLCDTEWKDIQSVPIADTKNSVILDAFRTGDRFHVVLRVGEDKQLAVRHVTFDACTLEVLDDRMLIDEQLQKGDEAVVRMTVSPDGQMHGLVSAVWGKEESRATAMLFDADMQKRWEQPLTYSDIFNVITTDNGTIVTMRMGMVEDNNDLTAFRINMATAEGVRQGEYVLEADVSDVALLNTDGHRVLAVALEGKGGYGLLRMGVLGNRKYTGLWGLVFDLDSQTISTANRHPFTDAELLTLSNESSGAAVGSRSIYFVSKVDDCTTPQGGAALYQHIWREETRDARSGMTTSETVYSEGILLVQADMQGELTVSLIPQNNQNARWPDVGADVFQHGDRLYVVTNESKEETDDYTPDKPTKRHKGLFVVNAAVSVYWFTPDGQGAKKVVERERKAVLKTPLVAGADNRFYFLATGSLHPNICTLTLPTGK